MTLVLDNYDSFGQPAGKAPRTVPRATSAPTLTVCSPCGAFSPRGDGAQRSALRTSFPAGRGYPSPHRTPAALRAANGRGETLATAGGRQDDP